MGCLGINYLILNILFTCQVVLFHESFDDPDLALRGWYDNTDVVISSVEHLPGSYGSAEYHWVKGSKAPASGTAIRKLFEPVESVCIDFWIKYSDGYTGSDKPYHPHEFMILTTDDDSITGPACTHLTTYIEQNEGIPQLGLQDGMNIDVSGLKSDLVDVSENRAVCGCNGIRQEERATYVDCYKANETMYWNGKVWKAEKPIFGESPGCDDQNGWHHIKVFLKLNTIENLKGKANGEMQYYFDNKLLINVTNVIMRTAMHPSMKFNQFIIAPWIGDGSPVDQSFWVDNLTVSTGLGEFCNWNN